MNTIGVVVPVYKTPFLLLEMCLDSIFAQTIQPNEVIVVDDGNDELYSKKLSNICRQYKKTILYKKENGGVSSARNYGLYRANSDYITFVDADDIVTPTMFERAIAILEASNADIVVGKILKTKDVSFINNFTLDEVNIELRECPIDKYRKSIFYNTKYYNYDFKYENGYGYIFESCNSKIYRRETIQKKFFDTKIKISEDTLWNYEISKLNPVIFLDDACWYIYVKNDWSATHCFNIDFKMILTNTIKTFEQIDLMRDVYSEYEIWKFYKIEQLLYSYFLNSENQKSIIEKKEEFIATINNETWYLKPTLKIGLKRFLKLLYYRSGLPFKLEK